MLDAHLSGRAIGEPLRKRGHDVLALDEHRELEGLSDVDVLELAFRDERLLITHNVQDFPDVLRERTEAGREHSGCLILVGVQLQQFGLILRLIEHALARFGEQAYWKNRDFHVVRSELGS